MKIKDIKHRCLVVGQDYDDFSDALNNVDFSQEDLCCQVLSLTNVYYSLNTESIWGPLGFIWDVYNNYGHFSPSSLKFDEIPKIPDSNRHLQLKDAFNTIDRPIVFNDSGWSHIERFNSLNNGSLIDWDIRSLDDGKNHVINYQGRQQLYILRGDASNITIDGITDIKLVPENKGKLNLDMSKVRNIDVADIDIPKDDTLDLSLYGSIKTPYTSVSMYKNIINSEKFKKIRCECNICTGTLQLLGIGTTDTEIKDKVTYVLRNDLVSANKVILNNYNSYKSREFEYVNIDSGKYTSINYYFRNGYFENGTPQVTDEIKSFTTNSVFKECHFYKKYTYGKVKVTSMGSIKMFDDCIAEKYNKSEGLYQYINKENGTGIEVKQSNRCIVDLSPVFDFDYTEEDYSKTMFLPSIPETGDFVYDLKVPYILNSAVIYVTSTGTKEYSGNMSSDIVLFDKENSVYVRNNSRFYFSYQSSGVNLYSVSTKLRQNQIIFETNKSNITESNLQFNNALLWRIYKDAGIKIPYIIRQEKNLFNYDRYSEAVRRRAQLFPDIDTECILYRVTVYFTRKDEPLDNALVQHILDSIVTVGDSTDAEGYEIRLLSMYYKAIKESTKNRLLGDGYTITEVL